MTRGILLLALSVLVGACAAPAINQETINSGNAEVTVELIATFDGVRLYRVHDGSQQTIYIAVGGTAVRAAWDEHHGKRTVRRETLAVTR